MSQLSFPDSSFKHTEGTTLNYYQTIKMNMQEIQKLLQEVDMNLKRVREKAVFNAKLVKAIQNSENRETFDESVNIDTLD